MKLKRELYLSVHCNRTVYTILMNYCLLFIFRGKQYILFDLDVHPEVINGLPNKFSKKTIAQFVHNYIVSHGYWRLWIDWFIHLGHAPFLVGDQVLYIDIRNYTHETEDMIERYIDNHDFQSQFKK